MLEELAAARPYARLEQRAAHLSAGLLEAGKRAGIPVVGNRVGSMMTLFFADQPVYDYASAKRADAARYGLYFRGMLERGIYFAPSQFEAAFVSTAHQQSDLEATIAAARDVFKCLIG
jgi:glutamate-1-semialdehyde 2,1-aminomutase